MGTQKDLVSRRDFLRHSVFTGSNMLVAGTAMKSLVLRAGVGVPADNGALKATVVVEAGAALHQIDRNIYGAFIEHIGRCVYGGVYEETSPLSDDQGFRKDVMKAASEWRVPILRWPGGNFASGYHWEDGVGPKESRPRRYNTAWYEEESNHFGTDEFIEYCRKISAAPYICVNLGTGTIQEAVNWVEYCNGTADTFYANLRRKYGHQEPYNVRYWGLGNEMYGGWQIGHKDADDYAKAALECGKLMKWFDPTIQLVACGMPDLQWNGTVLPKLIDIADYISLHDYEANEHYYEELTTVQRYYEELATIQSIQHLIQLTAEGIDLTDSLRGKSSPLDLSLPQVRTKKKIEIAFDEWNLWPRKLDVYRRDVPNPLEERYTLRDALWAASVLNLFQRMSDRVTMANVSGMINAIGMIFTSDHAMFLQPTYFAMKLYSRECGSQALACKVESPTFSSTKFKDVPYLDVAATLDDDRKKLVITAVNRHRSQQIEAKLTINNKTLASKATLFEINGASPEIENSFSEPGNVGIIQKEFAKAGEKFDYVFPAHSITLLQLNLA
jgi:alpha-L-arabinofuranosidase